MTDTELLLLWFPTQPPLRPQPVLRPFGGSCVWILGPVSAILNQLRFRSVDKRSSLEYLLEQLETRRIALLAILAIKHSGLDLTLSSV
jgi:hypothetical protein